MEKFNANTTYPADLLPEEIREVISVEAEKLRLEYTPSEAPVTFLFLNPDTSPDPEDWDDSSKSYVAFWRFRYVEKAFYLLGRPNDSRAPNQFAKVYPKSEGTGFEVEFSEYSGFYDANGEEVDFDKATPEEVAAYKA